MTPEPVTVGGRPLFVFRFGQNALNPSSFSFCCSTHVQSKLFNIDISEADVTFKNIFLIYFTAKNQLCWPMNFFVDEQQVITDGCCLLEAVKFVMPSHYLATPLSKVSQSQINAIASNSLLF